LRRPPAGPVTLRDVADRAGVDVATASRALRPGAPAGRATPATDRARQAAAELGYVRHEAAASLRTGRTGTVGLIAAGPGGPLQHGAEQELLRAGYMMITATAATRADARAAAAGLLARRADGIIVAGPWPEGQQEPAHVSGIPAVAASLAAGHAAYSAAPDLPAGAALAASCLARLGHRLVAVVSSPAAPLPARLLQPAAAAAGMHAGPRLTAAARADSVSEGRRCCRALLRSGVPFTAVLAGSDLLAAGCCAKLASAGRPCPAAVSVTGAGDLPLAGWLPVPLTTVTLPWRQAGAEAARLLAARLSDPGLPAAAVRLPGALVHRASTAPAPAA
jgi:LacI family transcriptional regulator, galactose operon repressor